MPNILPKTEVRGSLLLDIALPRLWLRVYLAANSDDRGRGKYIGVYIDFSTVHIIYKIDVITCCCTTKLH